MLYADWNSIADTLIRVRRMWSSGPGVLRIRGLVGDSSATVARCHYDNWNGGMTNTRATDYGRSSDS